MRHLRFAGGPLTHVSGQGFGRQRRLVRKKDYAQVFRAPLRLSDGCFTMLVAPSPAGTARLGLGISRRVSRRAVGRNRIKRLVRESFRRQQGMPAVDVVVLARPGADQLNNARLTASLEQLWTQLRKRVRASRHRQGNG